MSMMECPKCQKVFQQDKKFCSFDGTPLIEVQRRDDFIGYILDNKYQLEERIADGTTGSIYRAMHLQLEAPVAIKLMRRDLVNNPTAIERFRREAYAAMKIRHPNAIAVMDFGITSEDLVYVVMEYLVGEPLSARIERDGRIGILETNNIVQQICAVLTVAHNRGIVHRDLKPDNIFLHQEDGMEMVKVVDFGIAKLIQAMDSAPSNLTGMGAVIGTPHYISPEQCTARTVDARSDIYSLGVILYRLLTGKLPFEGPTSMALIYKQVTETPKPMYEVVPDIPAILNAVVMHAMEKDPDKRPQDVTSFARELAAAVQAISEQEFQKVFLDATDQDLEAAVLLTLDPSGSALDFKSGRFRTDPVTGKWRRVGTGELQTAEKIRQTGDLPKPQQNREPMQMTMNFLHGHFPECDLASVIHTLVGLELTGSLLVYTAKGTAKELARGKIDAEMPPPFCSLYIERGNIDRAKLGVRVGQEAFFQLLQMPVEGSYIFKPALFFEELRVLEPIVSTGEDLWREALALKEELKEYEEIFPDLTVEFEVVSKNLKWDERQSRDLAETVWYLLGQPEVNLSTILARVPCCNAKTFRILTLLLSTGQIRIVEGY